MSAPVCVDASVAAKFFLQEPGRPLAIALWSDVIGAGSQFVAPQHFPAEIASAIYKRTRDGEITIEQGRLLMAEATLLNVQLVNPPQLSIAALEIASRFRLKWIYDGLYVALAEIIGCEMWTADKALYETMKDAFDWLHLLSDYRPAR